MPPLLQHIREYGAREHADYAMALQEHRCKQFEVEHLQTIIKIAKVESAVNQVRSLDHGTFKGMPKFNNPYAEHESIKGHMAAVFRFWGKMGYCDRNPGHIT
ncbi:hypothetical protein H0H92_014708, partial [Tricholoma furcatifolium]